MIKKITAPIRQYTHWLHGQWPSGGVEKLPVAQADGSTNVAGLYIVGDLTGIPLLKFSADTGARAVHTIADDASFVKRDTSDDSVLDIAIVGGGVSGFSAAIEAQKRGLRFAIYESAEAFSTIVNFPKGKPIYTYPTEMTPAGDLQFHEQSDIKEGLLVDLREQTAARGIEPVAAHVTHVKREGSRLRLALGEGTEDAVYAHRVIVAIGRSGNYRELGVPGEDRDKVYNRLHDPKEYAGKNALVVGGGDSALETAIALAESGATVTVSYRKPELSRPKPDNIEKIERLQQDGTIALLLGSRVKTIDEAQVTITDRSGVDQTIANDVVFTMIGREAPLDFFRRSGVRIHGERTLGWWTSLIAFMVFCVWMYHWKKTGVHIADVWPLSWLSKIGDAWASAGWFPYNVPAWWESLGGAFADPSHLLGVLKISLGEPGFYYSFAYCSCVVLFGIDRIRRRRTPYVKWQTMTLMAVQCVPLFFLPYVLLPWIGNNGWFDSGVLKSMADALFPLANYGHGREYWRAFGFVLAWPLFFWNIFTSEPLWTWLAISVVQTFVLIPLLVYFYGKGAYCGWICSCGALAETLGDRHRHKMLHGPFWNRFNMVGQVFLVFALVLMVLRTAGWIMDAYAGGNSGGSAGENVGGSWPSRGFEYLFHDLPLFNYVWFVDLLWAGILGVSLYFWFSGRFWCRFACPLAALMHIYARFSQFRILAEKKKCISCNVCTSVCHQGIDVMNFANKGKPMADPECVRCSACVSSCPTGVLSFGRVARRTGEILGVDRLAASQVQMTEMTVRGQKI